MGWNSWNYFGADISDSLIRATTTAIVSSGMKDVGYEYVVIDDGWIEGRDSLGNPVANPTKFPNGIGDLANFVHSKGLKFGIYSSAGITTCQGLPGSYNYEKTDLKTYAEWGVDFLKYDWCIDPGVDKEFASMQRILYPKVGRIVNELDRDILFSIADGGMSKPWSWAKGIGHMWRISYDIDKCWESISHRPGFPEIADLMAEISEYAGPGHWNDADMLQVGNGCLNSTENIAHFSLWCILAAPLMLGNDITQMTDETLEIITNKEVIAINQDPLGRQGKKVRDDGNFEVWSKELYDGSRAVLLFNRSEKEAEIGFTWSEVGLPENLDFTVRDLWKKTDVGKFKGAYKSDVAPHGVVVVRLR